MNNIQCMYCESLITKQNLSRHHKSEQCIKIQKLIQKKENSFNDILSKEKDNYQKLNEQNHKLKELISKLNDENNKKDYEIKTLKDKSEEYRKIVEKSATKSTKTVNNSNTYNRNNYLNYVSSEPIKFGEIQKKINDLVTTKTIMYDNDNFNNYITKNILKDENGKNKVLCTDINRKNFTYKDETSGQMISDPELEKLREKLKNTSSNTSVKKDLLEKLISKYEGTGIDPYVRFYECIQNIEYGQPFVEHVAKKTYVKGQSPSRQESPSKSCVTLIDETENKTKIEQIEPISVAEPTLVAEVKCASKNDENDDDIDIDNINIDEVEDIEILDKILDKYEKRFKMMKDNGYEITLNESLPLSPQKTE